MVDDTAAKLQVDCVRVQRSVAHLSRWWCVVARPTRHATFFTSREERLRDIVRLTNVLNKCVLMQNATAPISANEKIGA